MEASLYDRAVAAFRPASRNTVASAAVPSLRVTQ
jgi:hypothetical protein